MACSYGAGQRGADLTRNRRSRRDAPSGRLSGRWAVRTGALDRGLRGRPDVDTRVIAKASREGPAARSRRWSDRYQVPDLMEPVRRLHPSRTSVPKLFIFRWTTSQLTMCVSTIVSPAAAAGAIESET